MSSSLNVHTRYRLSDRAQINLPPLNLAEKPIDRFLNYKRKSFFQNLDSFRNTARNTEATTARSLEPRQPDLSTTALHEGNDLVTQKEEEPKALSDEQFSMKIQSDGKIGESDGSRSANDPIPVEDPEKVNIDSFKERIDFEFLKKLWEELFKTHFVVENGSKLNI